MTLFKFPFLASLWTEWIIYFSTMVHKKELNCTEDSHLFGIVWFSYPPEAERRSYLALQVTICIPLFTILSFTSTAFGSCPKADVVCQLYYVKISLKYFCISEHVLTCIGPDVAERKVVYWNRLWHLSYWRKIFSFDVFVFLQRWSKTMLDNFGSLITAWNRNRFICESQNNN